MKFYQAPETETGKDYFDLPEGELDKELEKLSLELESEETPPVEVKEEIPEETIKTEEPELVKVEDSPVEVKEEAPKIDVLTEEMLGKIADSLDEKTPKDEFISLIKSKGLVGKPVSEFYKQYFHAQKMVGKRIVPEMKKEETPAQQIFPINAQPDEVAKVKNNIILDSINRQKKRMGISDEFELPPTLDETDPEYRTWYRDASIDNPLDLKLFERAYNNERNSLENAYTEYNKLRTTYPQVNDETAERDLKSIEEYFDNAGVKLSDYGINVKDDAVIAQLVYTDPGTKQVDNSLFNYINGEIPVLIPGALANKYMRTIGNSHLKEIIGKISEKSKMEGVVQQKNNIKPTNKGLGTQAGGETKPGDVGREKDPYLMTPVERDSYLKQMFQD